MKSHQIWHLGQILAKDARHGHWTTRQYTACCVCYLLDYYYGVSV